MSAPTEADCDPGKLSPDLVSKIALEVASYDSSVELAEDAARRIITEIYRLSRFG